MARFTAQTISKLGIKIRATDKQVDSALAQTLNRSATKAKALSVDFITQEVALEPSYVKRHIVVAKRASPSYPVAVLRANRRETLLARYPHQKSRKGIRVKVNTSSSFKEIKGAFIVRGLNVSGATGIAQRNVDAYRTFRDNFGYFSQGKQKKLQRLKRRAKENPRQIFVSHSRSVNQLFESARVNIQPRLNVFMADEFIDQLRRKS